MELNTLIVDNSRIRSANIDVHQVIKITMASKIEATVKICIHKAKET